MSELKKTFDTDFDSVISQLPEALRKEGFGVLTEIDIQKTLREKIGAEMPRYKIFGACNPPLAHRALLADIDVGVMLPCNVVVRQAEDGRTVVVAIDPMATIAAGHVALRPIAEDVRARLARVLEHLS